jgi:hypothetical protein
LLRELAMSRQPLSGGKAPVKDAAAKPFGDGSWEAGARNGL